jgi:hypothetical protein
VKSSNLHSTSWAAALAAALSFALLPSPARAAAARPDATLTVAHRSDGAYEVQGVFFASAAPARAWEVLTDYANLPSFVSSMRSSAATPGPGGLTLVVQEAVGKAGPFSRTLHVALEVREQAPHRIDFRDTSGRSFSSYAGSWTVEPAGDGVRVGYTLVAQPHSAPPFFARPILSSNARALLDEVRIEILRRESVRGAGTLGSR